MRNAFITELTAYAKSQKIALVVGDLGFSVIEPFVNEFPGKFINAGVAEQNMAGLAAGMASEGFHVFIYSIAHFPTFRCSEQIRNDIDYHNLPVTVVAVGGGVAYGSLGYSHHAVQDYALMRCMPNMLIAAPGDAQEVMACMKYLIDNPQPSYLRLNKAGEPLHHKSMPSIAPGKWLGVKKGSPCKVILSTGAALNSAIKCSASERFADYSVFSMPIWGMSSKNHQPDQMYGIESLITFEDHLIDGGFGSWMLESLAEYPELISKVKIRALSSKVCQMVGTQELLNEMGGL
jgi:transketolase